MKQSLFHITVGARECALVYRDGRLTKVLGPGRYRRTPRAGYVPVGLREKILQVAVQEVPTADGATVKIAGVVRWAVVEPVRFVEESADPVAVIYLAAQLALRDVVAAVPLEQVAEGALRRLEVADRLTATVAAAAATVGVEVRAVAVKDLILPTELRAAAASLVAARQQGLAQLERARAETAALRSLANGAKLLDAHPAMAQIRKLEKLPPGARVVLQVAASGDGAQPGQTPVVVTE